MLAIFSDKIDWSAIGTWVSALATIWGVFYARSALTTWKEQIRLKDRYEKADALLISFQRCIQSGHNWQYNGRNENDQETWKNALMQYRLDWLLARPLFEGENSNKLSCDPEVLQGKIISIGSLINGKDSGKTPDMLGLFHIDMEQLMKIAVDEITSRRNKK